jgi:hypothetical protein
MFELLRDVIIVARDTGMRNQRELYRIRMENLAPGHLCFPLTEDLHGCRSDVLQLLAEFMERLCATTVLAAGRRVTNPTIPSRLQDGRE